MIFTGTYEHSIDAKQRLAIPAPIRTQIEREARSGATGQGAAAGAGQANAVQAPFLLYVTLGDENTLCLYTEAGFEKRANELDNSALDAGQLLDYERLLFSLARQVELDKQGRIRLPENLLERTGLDGEVVMIGVKDHLEIRDRQGWNEYVNAKLDHMPGLMNPRRAMRSQAGP